jgi:hypothetical protein
VIADAVQAAKPADPADADQVVIAAVVQAAKPADQAVTEADAPDQAATAAWKAPPKSISTN